MNNKHLSKIMSELGKKSAEKTNRPREYFVDMANKRWSKQNKTSNK